MKDIGNNKKLMEALIEVENVTTSMEAMKTELEHKVSSIWCRGHLDMVIDEVESVPSFDIISFYIVIYSLHFFSLLLINISEHKLLQTNV